MMLALTIALLVSLMDAPQPHLDSGGQHAYSGALPSQPEPREGAPAAISTDEPGGHGTDGAAPIEDSPAPPEVGPAEAPSSSRPCAGMDVCFCVDTTGSMWFELDRVLWSIQDVIGILDDDNISPRLRYALVLFRDVGCNYTMKVHNFMSAAELDRAIAGILCGKDPLNEGTDDWLACRNGTADAIVRENDDYPEAVAEAMYAAVHEVTWENDTSRAIYLIGDAPPHMPREGGIDPIACARDAAGLGITINVLGMPGIGGHEAAFMEFVNITGGTFEHYATYWPMHYDSSSGEVDEWSISSASSPSGEDWRYGSEDEWRDTSTEVDDEGTVDGGQSPGQGQGQGLGQGQGQGQGQGNGQGQQGPDNLRQVLFKLIRDQGRSAGFAYGIHHMETQIMW